MFSAGLKSIYKKINSIKDKVKQNEAFNYLENQLISNPYIKHQFELLSTLKEKQGRITTQDSFNSFVKGLRQKHASFLTENKDASQLTVWKENKRLFEYFNINSKELNLDEYDVALDIYSTAKGLNEGIIKTLVKKSVDSDLKLKKKNLKESFSRLKVKENALSLNQQFNIINFLSECMQITQKKFTQSSLHSLKEERYKNYGNCVEKTFKLRLLCEKTISDYVDEDEVGQYGGGKRVKVQDLKYIKRIEISTPVNWQRPEKIILNFRIPVYPIGATRNAAITSALRIKSKINKLERIFVNSSIYQKNKTKYFDPVGTIWEVSLREQVTPGQAIEARVTCYISTAKEAEGKISWDQYKTLSYELLKDFDKILPQAMGNFIDVLTPHVQKDEIKNTKGLSQKDKLAYASRNGQVDVDLLRRKTGSGGEDYENRSDNFSGPFGDVF